MKTTVILRIAAVVMFLFAAGHSLGGKDSWSPAGETDVLRAMRSVRFHTMGVERTYLDFYTGFGWSLSIFLLLLAVMLWQIAAIARTDPMRVRALIASLLVANVGLAVVSWIWILPVPAVFAAVIAVCLGVAFFTAAHDESKLPS